MNNVSELRMVNSLFSKEPRDSTRWKYYVLSLYQMPEFIIGLFEIVVGVWLFVITWVKLCQVTCLSIDIVIGKSWLSHINWSIIDVLFQGFCKQIWIKDINQSVILFATIFLEKWFFKLGFFFWSTTFLEPEKMWIHLYTLQNKVQASFYRASKRKGDVLGFRLNLMSPSNIKRMS